MVARKVIARIGQVGVLLLVLVTVLAYGIAPRPAANRRTTIQVNPYFSIAQEQWKRDNSAFAFEQSFDWLEIAASLRVGIVHDVAARSKAGRKQYGVAIAELVAIAGLPETSETPEQQRLAARDVAALNKFFDTSSLYS